MFFLLHFCGLLELPGPFFVADRRQNMQLFSKKLKGRFFQCYSIQISKQVLPSVISQEIGSKSDRVDHAIQVLISAGMSTPALRLCAERGVDVSCAGHAEVAVPVVILGPQPLCRDLLEGAVVGGFLLQTPYLEAFNT